MTFLDINNRAAPNLQMKANRKQPVWVWTILNIYISQHEIAPLLFRKAAVMLP